MLNAEAREENPRRRPFSVLAHRLQSSSASRFISTAGAAGFLNFSH